MEVFILEGIRFAVMTGADFQDEKNIKQLGKQNVTLLFVLVTSPAPENREKDKEKIIELSKQFSLDIIRCNATGRFMNSSMAGQSLIANPTGIGWQVPPHEESREILKTIVVKYRVMQNTEEIT